MKFRLKLLEKGISGDRRVKNTEGLLRKLKRIRRRLGSPKRMCLGLGVSPRGDLLPLAETKQKHGRRTEGPRNQGHVSLERTRQESKTIRSDISLKS